MCPLIGSSKIRVSYFRRCSYFRCLSDLRGNPLCGVLELVSIPGPLPSDIRHQSCTQSHNDTSFPHCISEGVQKDQREPRDSNRPAGTRFWSPRASKSQEYAPHAYPDSSILTRQLFRSDGRPGRRAATQTRIEYDLSIVDVLRCALPGGGVCAQRFWIIVQASRCKVCFCTWGKYERRNCYLASLGSSVSRGAGHKSKVLHRLSRVLHRPGIRFCVCVILKRCRTQL